MDYWIKKSSLVGDPILNQDIYAGNCIGPLTFPLFFATMIRYVPLREIIKKGYLIIQKRKGFVVLNP